MLLDSFWNPFQRRPLLVGTILGLALLLLRSFISAYYSQTDAPILSAIAQASGVAGTAVLVSGVFTAIVKSSQFAEIFQAHLMDALYHPSKIHTSEQSRQNWTNLTKSMLDRTLDSDASKVTQKIYETFLNSDLELSHTYHDVSVTYDISVANDGTAKILNTLKTTLKIPVGVESPKFRQWLTVNGSKRLTYLRIGNSIIDTRTAIPSAPNALKDGLFIEYPLAGHIDAERTVEVERTFELEQNLLTEPFITVLIEKYVFGLEVRVKISSGYQITYMRSGTGVNRDSIPTDGQGFLRWVVAPSKSLLLPGSGFTLIVTKR